MKNYIFLGLLVILVAGVSFYGGTEYQKNKQSKLGLNMGQFNQKLGQNQEQRNGDNARIGGNFRPVVGEVLTVEDKSITVKLADGSSKIIFISEKTQINKIESVENTDIVVGAKVNIFGVENSDGSMTAENVQLNSLMRYVEIPSTDQK